MVVDKLLIQQTESIHVQFFRYGIVGGMAFVVDYAFLIGLTEFAGLNYLASAAVAFIAGLVTNYLLSVNWVFSHRSLSDKRAEFVVFAVIGVVGLGLTEVVLFVGTDLAGIDYRIVKLVAVGLVFFWNFGARKAVLFRGGQSKA